MTVKVYIPTPFRALTEKQARVEVHPGTVGDALQELESRYPGMRERLRDPQGALFEYINVYVNSQAIDDLQGEGTAIKDGDEMSIIPAVAGAPEPCLPRSRSSATAGTSSCRTWGPWGSAS